MPSLLPVSVNGRKYWRIVESRRINGKPRPVPICYLGTVEHILEVFNSLKDRKKQMISSNDSSTKPYDLEQRREFIHAEVSQNRQKGRLDKTLNWLRKSRDNWKLKAQKAKFQLKVKTLCVKRLRKLRDELKSKLKKQNDKIDHLQIDFDNAQNEIAQLKRQLEATEDELTAICIAFSFLTFR